MRKNDIRIRLFRDDPNKPISYGTLRYEVDPDMQASYRVHTILTTVMAKSAARLVQVPLQPWLLEADEAPCEFRVDEQSDDDSAFWDELSRDIAKSVGSNRHGSEYDHRDYSGLPLPSASESDFSRSERTSQFYCLFCKGAVTHAKSKCPNFCKICKGKHKHAPKRCPDYVPGMCLICGSFKTHPPRACPLFDPAKK